MEPVWRVLEQVKELALEGAAGKGTLPESVTPEFLLEGLRLYFKIQLLVVSAAPPNPG